VSETPRCRHFGRCGGCTLLPVPIEAQLCGKAARVRELLDPWLGGVGLEVPAPPALAPRFDRTRLLYPVQPGPDGVLRAGLFASGTHDVVEIEECAIQAEALTLLAQRFVGLLRARGVAPYDESAHRGSLRALFARIAPGTGELVAGLVTAGGTLPLQDVLVPQLVQAGADLPPLRPRGVPVRLVGLVHNENAARGNALLGATTHTLHGRDHVFDLQDGLTFRVGSTSFYQLHQDASALLYRPALQLAGSVAGQRLVDGYGGVGTFALRLAAAGAARVELIEAHAGACADARAAAAANGLADRIEVACVPFAEARAAPDPDLCVVDPPRAGLLPEGVARVRALAPRRLLYVSCAPASLARDLAGLADRYAVRAARLCDLFPHTDHCEVLVLLARRAASGAG